MMVERMSSKCQYLPYNGRGPSPADPYLCNKPPEQDPIGACDNILRNATSHCIPPVEQLAGNETVVEMSWDIARVLFTFLTNVIMSLSKPGTFRR